MVKERESALPPAASALFSRSLPLRQTDSEGSGFLSVVLWLCSVPSEQRITDHSIRSHISEPRSNNNGLWENSTPTLTAAHNRPLENLCSTFINVETIFRRLQPFLTVTCRLIAASFHIMWQKHHRGWFCRCLFSSSPTRGPRVAWQAADDHLARLVQTLSRGLWGTCCLSVGGEAWTQTAPQQVIVRRASKTVHAWLLCRSEKKSKDTKPIFLGGCTGAAAVLVVPSYSGRAAAAVTFWASCAATSCGFYTFLSDGSLKTRHYKSVLLSEGVLV